MPCNCMRMYLWWSVCTLYEDVPLVECMYLVKLYEDVPLMECMYLVFMRMYLWWSVCTLYL